MRQILLRRKYAADLFWVKKFFDILSEAKGIKNAFTGL